MFLKTMTKKSTLDFSVQFETLKAALQDCDALVIGAGAGLSASAGFLYDGDRFTKYFSDFYKKYRFSDMYSGGFYPYDTLEEYWGFWSRDIYINRYMNAPKPIYETLFSLVKNKDYFVLTTNVDHCFQKAGFDKKRLFYTQGDYGLFQCPTPCHRETYENAQTVRKMVEAQGFTIGSNGELLLPEDGVLKTAVPTELAPRCPHCGKPLTMNLRCDDSFVEDEGWHVSAERYTEFIRRHEGAKVLFWELGVGFNTPVFCSSSTRDNSTNIRLKQQISGFSFNKQRDLEKGGMRNVWQKNVKSRKHAGLYQQAA